MLPMLKPLHALSLLLAVSVITLLALQPAAAQDTERILSFHSDITIHRDSSMTVTETIRVVATGDSIRHGIYRDLPIRYRDVDKRPFLVRLNVKSVLLDGVPEPYFIDNMGNDRRIYIGDEDVFIPPGVYQYQLTYSIQRMLGFFDDHDELYWNVTGTGWGFTIEEAAARVTLPRSTGRDGFRLAGYTGPQGSTVEDYSARVVSPETVEFVTNSPLAPGENLTIVVGFPKGIVTPPSAAQLREWWVDDHLSEIVGFTGLVTVLLYYFLVWVFFGRDPRRRTSWLRDTPPADMSPAALRYVMRMGGDNTAYTAALISLAAKGWLILELAENGDYTVRRGETRRGVPSPEEQRVYDVIFNGRDSLLVDQDNHKIFGDARDALKASLGSQLYQVYFIRNQWGLTGGIAMSVLTFIVMTAFCHEPIPLLMTTIFTSVFMGVIVAVAGEFLSSHDQLFAQPWTNAEVNGAETPRWLAVGVGIIAVLLMVPFLIIGFTVSWLTAPILIGLILANCIFALLLPAYTQLGRRLMDETGGFRMWLASPESGRYTAEQGEELTRFEKLLPYAIALGIEQEWTKRFEEALTDSGRAEMVQYYPAWYRTYDANTMDHRIYDLGKSFAKEFSSSLSSASTAPSSGGSGFSGSSGGGGGGGGGGGW